MDRLLINAVLAFHSCCRTSGPSLGLQWTHARSWKTFLGGWNDYQHVVMAILSLSLILLTTYRCRWFLARADFDVVPVWLSKYVWDATWPWMWTENTAIGALSFSTFFKSFQLYLYNSICDRIVLWHLNGVLICLGLHIWLWLTVVRNRRPMRWEMRDLSDILIITMQLEHLKLDSVKHTPLGYPDS